MASPLKPSPSSGGGWSINDLPHPPSLRLLGWLGAALFAIAIFASLLFALLLQRVSATGDAPAHLDTAIAATAPITTVNLPNPAPVVLLLIGDLRASDSSWLDLDPLPAARWQIDSAARPPSAYLTTLLDGSSQTSPLHPSASRSVEDALKGPLTDTLATTPLRTVMVNFQPRTDSGDSGVVWRVQHDVQSGQYDLIIATLPGLRGCHEASIYCQGVVTQLGSDIKQTASAASSVSGTLVVVGDYEAPSVTDDYISQQSANSRPMLLFSGPLIKPGNYGTTSIGDVAPTIAALLGGPPPVLSDGQILWPALNLAAASASVAEYDLAAQRSRLAEATAALTNQPLPLASELRADLRAAYEALLVPDYPSATSLSSHAFSAATQQLAAVQQSAANLATWPRLPILLLALTIPLVAFIRWRRQLGYARPIVFYIVLALTSLLLQISLLLLIGYFITLDYSALPTDWFDLGAIEISALVIAALGQALLVGAAALLYNRAHRRALAPGPQQTRASEVAVWQLRLDLPLSGPVLWGAAYTAALTLLVLLTITAAALYWQYGFAPDFPPPDRNATLALLCVLVLSAANALFAIFPAPLVAIAVYRLTHRRKPHPLLLRPPAKKGKHEPEPLPYQRDKWGLVDVAMQLIYNLYVNLAVFELC